MQMNHPQRPPEIAGMKHTVLGEMHGGKLQVDESHRGLKKMVRLAIVVNLMCLFGLWLGFRVKSLFPPHDAPFMNAFGWYFFFGAMYGAIGHSFYSYGRFKEVEAVIKAVTPNRRYEWHSRYDTANMKDEDLKKVADGPGKAPASGRHEQSAAKGVGGKSYFYAGIFVLWAFIICAHGIYGVVQTLF
jgi:hypothetical protein